MKLGEGPRERSNSYYGYSSCSCLGFAVYLPTRAQPVYIDLLSENLSHDAPTAVMAFRMVIDFLYTHPDLKEDAKKARKLRVWCDCGPHFRAKRFFAFLFVELPEMEVFQDIFEIVFGASSRRVSLSERTIYDGFWGFFKEGFAVGTHHL